MVKRAAAKPAAKAATKPSTTTTHPPLGLEDYRCVVINLQARPDRWKRVSKAISTKLPWLPYERLDAVDGRAAPPPVADVTLSWSTAHIASFDTGYKVVTLEMSPGERGCCSSHVESWRRCAHDRKPLIVLEDDAVVLPPLAATLAKAAAELAALKPPGADVLWLCAKDRGRARRLAAGGVLMRPEFVWTTVGYVLYPRGARRLLKALPVDEPVDNFIARLIRAGTLVGFSVRPGVVRQASTWNIGSDVPHSDDVAH